MGHIKGVSIESLRSYAREELPPGTWDQIVAVLPESEQETVRRCLAVEWVPIEAYGHLLHAFEQHVDLRALGSTLAERELNTIYRVVLRLLSPATITTRGLSLWKRFHDTGAWTTERRDHGVTGHLDDWALADASACRILTGWIARMVELAGARDVVVEHPRCRARGDTRCTFEVRWQA